MRSFPGVATAALLALLACNDREIVDQAMGGGGATAAAGPSSTASGSTSSSSGATTGSTSSSGGGGSSEGGGGSSEGGGGEAQGGAGGGGGSCAEQPAPFQLSDVDAPCQEIEAQPNPPRIHVEWLDVPTEPLVFENEVALDFAFPFVLQLPLEELGSIQLVHWRCIQMATQDEETCDEAPLDLGELDLVTSCSEVRAPRYGIDPTSYEEGENHYRFGMRIEHGCAAVDTEFEMTVIYQPQD
jgi:hypothetical protein